MFGQMAIGGSKASNERYRWVLPSASKGTRDQNGRVDECQATKMGRPLPLPPPPQPVSPTPQVEARRSGWEHRRLVPPSSSGGGGGFGGRMAAAAASAAAGAAQFAPFQPGAEDHLRTFAVSTDERRQMEEDYRLALALQKNEAVAARDPGVQKRVEGGGAGGELVV